MKFTIFALLAFSINSVVIAKKQMKDFNKAMQEEISGFVKHNPEKYETKDITRKPASASPVEVVEEKKNEEAFEKMDGFDQQGIGLPKW